VGTRRALVAANWKMNGTLAVIRPLVRDLLEGLADFTHAEVAVCVPFPYLAELHQVIRDSRLQLGAQNVSEHEAGAYTGEVSAAMLKDYNCRFVIVGHSERRHLFGESSGEVARRFVRASGSGLEPILCVGERLEEREGGATETVIAEQLEAVLSCAGIEAVSRAVIAYEPVWAIGTGLTATPEQAQEAHAFIRALLARHDAGIARDVRIIYGGSVKPENAEAIFTKPDVDGGLIGGASLVAGDFINICRVAR
jgi:triosephosphate isomerase (TIM)